MNPYVEVFFFVSGLAVGFAIGCAMILSLLKMFENASERRRVKTIMNIAKKEDEAIRKAAKKKEELKKHRIADETPEKSVKGSSLSERFSGLDEPVTDFIYDDEEGVQKLEDNRKEQDSSYEYLSDGQ